jgi:nicotinate dehydrogenase subunit B
MTGEPASPDRLDSWLRFELDGTVRIFTGKVELGQGIHEALSIVVADELDVALSRVSVAPVDTASSQDEGLTAGSRSIEETSPWLRRAAATARRALLVAAGRHLGVGIEGLAVRDGVVSAPNGASVAYQELVPVNALRDVVVDPGVPLKAARERRLIGSSPLRRDLVPKVSGGRAFLHDLELPGMLHGRVVRPSGPGAALESLDRDAIREMAGVVSIVRDGDFVGIVAEREDQAIAAQARARSGAKWRPGPALPNLTDARYLLDFPAEEIVVRDRRDVARAAPVARTIAAEYTRPLLAHAAIGPSCAIACLNAAGLEVWSHSQGIFRLRHELALVLGLAEQRVRVHHVEGAGSYGHNGADDVALDAALLARDQPGRPVRVQWTREDEFGWEPYGPAMIIRISADIAADGTILEWRHDLWGHGHENRPWQGGRPDDQSALLAARHLSRPFAVPGPRRPRTTTSGGQRNSVPYYRFARERIVDHFVADAPVRVSSLRSLGAHANVFAIESFMDELAAATGVDPVTLRLRHIDDPRATAVIAAALDEAGPAPARTATGEVLRGRGLGFARYKNTAAYAAVVCDVELGLGIRVPRVWAAVDAGMVVSLDGLRNQAEGGIVQALSWTLVESVRSDAGGILGLDWDGYPILGFADAPRVEVTVIDRPDVAPVGAGEAFAGPTSAAVANAIADASGIRLRDLPLTRDRFVEAVGRRPGGDAAAGG